MNTSYSTQTFLASSINTKIRPLGMPFPTHQQWLDLLNQSKYVSHDIDFYNQGELVELLEQRVAKLLNKPAALFFGKGMVAQFSAFKAVEEKTNNSNIALHPMSHLAFDEDESYKHLLNLNGILIGEVDQPFSLTEVLNIEQSIATLAVEIPLRRAGFKLTNWEQLIQMSDWCANNQVHFHMDGARLWESSVFYDKPIAEVASLFDSVYVSLYKGLGAMGGAVLAGDVEFIEACKVWRSRFGGCSFTFFPQIISALEGLDNRLNLIPSYVQRAYSIAQLLTQFPQLSVNQPQTNGFFVFLDGDKHSLTEKSNELNQKLGIKLFNQVSDFPETDKLMIEIQVGALHQDISDEEIVEYFKLLLG